MCLFIHDIRGSHLALIKCILRYVKGTLEASLHIGIGVVESLTVYFDTDWAGYLDSWRSTYGFYIFLGENLVSWFTKRQTMCEHKVDMYHCGSMCDE